MKAAVYTAYGDERCIALRELPIPVPGAKEVLIRIKATAINGSDWEFLTGHPAYARLNGLRKPRKTILGSDIAGTIETVGDSITDFLPGDRVVCDNFERYGGFAEFVCVPETKLVRKPHGLSFEQAAAVPQSGVIALQSLRQTAALDPGQTLLVNGAAGGVGAFAVQMALAQGIKVVGIDHGNKLGFLRELGVTEVYDYRQLETAELLGRFDKIIDLVGGHPVSEFKDWLTATGHYIAVGGPVRHLLATLWAGLFNRVNGRSRLSILAHQQNENDILAVSELVETGQIKAPISKVYPLDQIQQAFRDFRLSTAKGKVMINPQRPL